MQTERNINRMIFFPLHRPPPPGKLAQLNTPIFVWYIDITTRKNKSPRPITPSPPPKLKLCIWFPLWLSYLYQFQALNIHYVVKEIRQSNNSKSSENIQIIHISPISGGGVSIRARCSMRRGMEILHPLRLFYCCGRRRKHRIENPIFFHTLKKKKLSGQTI